MQSEKRLPFLTAKAYHNSEAFPTKKHRLGLTQNNEAALGKQGNGLAEYFERVGCRRGPVSDDGGTGLSDLRRAGAIPMPRQKAEDCGDSNGGQT